MERFWLFRVFHWPVAMTVSIVILGAIFYVALVSVDNIIDRRIEQAITKIEFEYKDFMSCQGVELPEKLVFCGDRVDLENTLIRIKLMRMMADFLDDRYTTSVYLSFLPYYQSWFEKILQENGLPDDFKYATVIESELDVFAESPRGAKGPWQFMPRTAKWRGLKIIKGYLDERFDQILATEAAADHFNYLYDRFGNWQLVLASYNAGDGNINSAIKRQGNVGYTSLLLPQETEEYVYRIMAFKIIAENPEQYGIMLSTDQYFTPMQFDTLTIEAGRTPITFTEIASACGVSAEEIKILNPAFLKNEIRGTQTIRLPGDTKELFKTNYYKFN